MLRTIFEGALEVQKKVYFICSVDYTTISAELKLE